MEEKSRCLKLVGLLFFIIVDYRIINNGYDYIKFKMSKHNDFLSIIKSFMIDIHSEMNEQNEQLLGEQYIEMIDRAAIEVKTNKENIVSLQNQNHTMISSRTNAEQVRKENQILEKKISRKNQEIDILKETVKTLYNDNEKINQEKKLLSKQIITLKENITALKKKNRRQDEQMSNHKIELQKLTSLAEERLNEYVGEDQAKQIKIKKLVNELQKVKDELTKKEKRIEGLNGEVEKKEDMERDYEKSLKAIQRLKEENKGMKRQSQQARQKMHCEKIKYVHENSELLKKTEDLSDQISKLVSQRQQYGLKCKLYEEKVRSYEEEILIRTQKLKQKNKQIKTYNDEIEKLGKRVHELSFMTDQLMTQNKDLASKNSVLQQKFQQFKTLHSHLGKMKGELSYKKSIQLARLIDSINRLQANL